MKASISILSLLMLSYSAPAFAKGGDKVGGGGDVFRCVRPSGKVIHQLLDIAEAQPRGLNLDLGGSTLTILQKIDLMAARLAEIDPDRAAKYRAEVIKMHEDLEDTRAGRAPRHGLAVLTPDELEDYDDSLETFKKTSYIDENGNIEKVKCDKFQLVFQKDQVNVTDPAYEFQRDLWLKLDADNQVATYYHEAIYREFRKLGHKDSRSVRSFNSWLFSGRITTLGSCHYVGLLAKAGVLKLNLFGQIPVSTKVGYDVACDSSGEINKVTGAHAKYPINLSGNRKIFVDDIIVEDRQIISARSLTQFSLVGSKLVTHEWTNSGTVRLPEFGRGGTVTFGPGDAVTLTDMENLQHGGNVSVIWKSDSSFEVIKETRQFEVSQSGMGNDVKEILSCSRTILQKRLGGVQGVDLVARVLTEARQVPVSGDASKMKSLANECSQFAKRAKRAHKSVKTEMRAAITQVADPQVQHLMSGFFDVQNRNCKMFGVSASAGLGVGVKLGAHGLSCTLSDGRRVVYFGPQVGFSVSTIGASVAAGAVSNIPSNQGLTKRFDSLSGIDEDKGVAFVYAPGSDDLSYSITQFPDGANDLTEDKSVHVGLRATGWQLHASGLIRIFKKSDDFYGLMEYLFWEIAVDQK